MIENGKPAGGDAVLISVPGNRELPELVEEHLDELAFLAETAGLATINVLSKTFHTPTHVLLSERVSSMRLKHSSAMEILRM